MTSPVPLMWHLENCTNFDTTAYSESPVNNWAANRECWTCGIKLLTGERVWLCCSPNGSHYSSVQPLPPSLINLTHFWDPLPSQVYPKSWISLFLCHNGTCTCSPYPWGPQLCCGCRVNILPSLYVSIRQYCCPLDAMWWFEVLFIPHHTYMWDISLLWVWAIQTSLTQYNPFASSVQSLQNF